MADRDTINAVRKQINKIQNQHANQIVVGWNPTHETHVEGDVWTDYDDKQWTIKNGIKQNVTKLDAAKTPWFCPECEKTMRLNTDTKYFNLFGKCTDCVIKYETKLRAEGKWKEYEERKMLANYVAFIRDKIVELKDYHRTVADLSIIHADDHNILMIEKWDIDVPTVQKNLQDEIDYLTNELQITIDKCIAEGKEDWIPAATTV